MNLENKELQLLHFLYHQTAPISSKKLAEIIGVSSRSIKKYVANINSYSSERLIIGTRRGYMGVPEAIASFLKDKNIPQSAKERIDFIIKRTLFNLVPPDIIDLSLELFVSESTISNDIRKINEIYKATGVSFHIKNTKIIIRGNEKNIQKFMSKTILQQANKQFLNLNILQKMFPTIDCFTLYYELSDFFKSEEIYTNELAKVNIILHLLIIIERIKMNSNIKSLVSLSIPLASQKIITRLIKNIEKKFDINFNEYEKKEIISLIVCNTNFSSEITKNYFDEKTVKGFFDFIFITLSKVEKNYGITLNTKTFLTPFLFHLSNLYLRVNFEHESINSILPYIKEENPLIFDIAVFIATKIADFLNIEKISEIEISYIAIHLGAEIFRKKIAADKIKVILFSPAYLGLEELIYNKLLFQFGNDIEIIDILSSPDKISNIQTVDLIITTVPLNQNIPIETVLLSTLNENFLYQTINKKIHFIRLKKNLSLLEINLDAIISEAYFEKNISEKAENKFQLIEFLSKNLSGTSITNKAFFENVIKREKSSSTAFGKIAIPHSIELNTLETKLIIGVDKNGFIWDNQAIVNIVFLISINTENLQEFRHIFEALLYLFENENIIDYLAESTTALEFKNRIKSFMKPLIQN